MSGKLGPYELNSIVTGDARELAKAIPDGSIDFILCDPVYQNIDDYKWLSILANRILKPGGGLVAYFAMYHLPATIEALSTGLTYCWLIYERNISGNGTIWKYKLKNKGKQALWFYKPPFQAKNWTTDFLYSIPAGNQVNHEWSKNPMAISELITRHTLPEDIVFDPFCGGGSILAEAKKLNRPYLGFEEDDNEAEAARRRLAGIQGYQIALLPQPVQLDLLGVSDG